MSEANQPINANLIRKDKAYRQDIRDFILSEDPDSLYFFVRWVLGYDRLVPHLHGDLCRFVSNPKHLRKLITIPRSFYKTTCITIGRTVWSIARDPSIRILLATHSQNFSQVVMSIIRKTFEGAASELFSQIFPELVPTTEWRNCHSWNDKTICVPRPQEYKENTIHTIGVGGAIAGHHFDMLMFDDLISEQTAESELEMERVITWFKYGVSLFDDARVGESIVTGTRYGHHDLYSFIMANMSSYVQFHRGVLYDDGSPVFPEKYNEDDLARIREEQGDWIFSCQYMNNPQEADRTKAFNPKWLRYWKWTGQENHVSLSDGTIIDLSKCQLFMICDPALSKKKRDARSAIELIAFSNLAHVIVLEAIAFRGNPPALVNKLLDVYKKWTDKKLSPEFCVIESVQFQEALKWMVDKEARLQDIDFCRIRLEHPGSSDKDDRIIGLHPYAKHGQIHISDHHADFKTEWMLFPSGKRKDLLDALTYAPRVWRRPTDKNDDEGFEGTAWLDRRRSAEFAYEMETDRSTGY